MPAKLSSVESDLLDAIRCSWGRDTSYEPDVWSLDNPAWGQCAVTSLVIQDYFGGNLLRVTDGHATHYWNRVDGVDIDLTLMQFPSTPTWTSPAEFVDREYVLSWSETRVRYDRLRRRVAHLLAHR